MTSTYFCLNFEKEIQSYQIGSAVETSLQTRSARELSPANTKKLRALKTNLDQVQRLLESGQAEGRTSARKASQRAPIFDFSIEREITPNQE